MKTNCNCCKSSKQVGTVKIINKNATQEIIQLNPKQSFASEILRLYYDTLQDQFVHSAIKTMHKTIILPKYNKITSTKNSYIEAIDILNKLPNEPKTLDIQHAKVLALQDMVLEVRSSRISIDDQRLYFNSIWKHFHTLLKFKHEKWDPIDRKTV